MIDNGALFFHEFCRQNMASYKVPRFVEFRSDLPKTMVGKVLQRVLLEEEKRSRPDSRTGCQPIPRKAGRPRLGPPRM